MRIFHQGALLFRTWVLYWFYKGFKVFTAQLVLLDLATWSSAQPLCFACIYLCIYIYAHLYMSMYTSRYYDFRWSLLRPWRLLRSDSVLQVRGCCSRLWTLDVSAANHPAISCHQTYLNPEYPTCLKTYTRMSYCLRFPKKVGFFFWGGLR